MKKILVACPSISSPFVNQDVEFLRKAFQVETVSFDKLSNPKIITVPFWVLKTLIFKKYDCLLIWFSIPKFSPLLTLIAKLFGKKVLVIAGGYDITFVPEINWGEMGVWWKRIAQKFSFFWVDHIFAFSDFSRKDIIKYVREEKVSTLYFGIDADFFCPKGEKENLIVTTCFQITQTSILQKGLDSFMECALKLPGYRFLIIGQIDKSDSFALDFFKNAPPNLEFTNRFVTNEELRDYYRRAKIYVQLSAHEGFGIAVAEAMACECIPVGTKNTSLDEVIGNEDYLVNFNDRKSAVKLIQLIFDVNSSGDHFRNRVVKYFKPDTRSSQLNLKTKNILKVE